MPGWEWLPKALALKRASVQTAKSSVRGEGSEQGQKGKKKAAQPKAQRFNLTSAGNLLPWPGNVTVMQKPQSPAYI